MPLEGTFVLLYLDRILQVLDLEWESVDVADHVWEQRSPKRYLHMIIPACTTVKQARSASRSHNRLAS